MRRWFFRIGGILELALAFASCALAVSLPNQTEVAQGFFAAIEITRKAHTDLMWIHDSLPYDPTSLAAVADEFGKLGQVLQINSRAVLRCLSIGKLLAWLVAAIAAAHGCFLIACQSSFGRLGSCAPAKLAEA